MRPHSTAAPRGLLRAWAEIFRYPTRHPESEGGIRLDESGSVSKLHGSTASPDSRLCSARSSHSAAKFFAKKLGSSPIRARSLPDEWPR